MTRFDKIKNTTCVANRQKANDATDIKNTAKNRSRAGFTITEVLLVVAILVVLFAVAIIGISSYQASLRQKELDSKAEVIYMAAQNRLTELAAAGREDLYDPEATMTTSTGTEAARKSVDVFGLKEIPIDNGSWGTEVSVDSLGLYYVKSTSRSDGTESTPTNILPKDRVEAEIWDNNWIIEYNPKSGSVYGVFYSEETVTYDDSLFNKLRIKKYRLSQGAKVGYYGGDIVAKYDTDSLTPTIDVHNAEELYATISCAYSKEDLVFEITVEDEFGNKWTTTISRTQMKIVNSACTYHLELDNLNNGRRFKDVYGEDGKNGGTGGKLVPGSDITVTVVSKCSDSLIDDGIATTNAFSSLYDSVEDVAGTNGQSGYKQAVISCARHLQNLDEDSGVTGLVQKGQDKFIKAAVQKGSIHLENDEANQEDWGALYAAKGITFKPIENKYLDSYTGSYNVTTSSGTTESARSIICGLETTKGLFDTFYGSTLKDITLTGTKLSASTGTTIDYAGGLCAETTGTSLTVEGCRVYLDEAEGNLTGKTEKDVWITAQKGAGGLIGKANGSVRIEESFAASVVGSYEAAEAGNFTTQYTGGLVGYMASGSSLSIDKSYADCYLYGQNVGGLIGGKASGTISITSSYAAGFISASEKAAGFVPEAISGVNAAYSVMHISTATEDDSKFTSYAVAKSCNGTKSNIYYMKSGKITDEDLGKRVEYTTLNNRSQFITSSLNSYFSADTSTTNTHAYNLKELGLTDYSYPKIDGVPHYGDWQASFESGVLVYYEVYKDSDGNLTYGVFGANLQSLAASGEAIGDGYGIIYDENPGNDVTVDITYGNNESASASGSSKFQITEDKWIIPLPAEVVNTNYAPENFYQEIIVDGVTYYYNPHFARTVNTSMPESAGNVIYVRTARQLYNMSLYYGDYAIATAGKLYSQGLKINYTDYEWTKYAGTTEKVASQNPIGSGSGLEFNAVYDGNKHVIMGVSIYNTEKNSPYVGLFGNNEGTLRNIFLVWDYQNDAENDVTIGLSKTIQDTQAAYMGGLAGINTKTIQNCSVAGYTFGCATYENSTSYIGGLVGWNEGTILDSYADTPKFTLAADQATVYMGGLVGSNRTRIESCYASGAIKVSESKEGTVRIGGFYGENGGTISNAYCTTHIVTTDSAKGYGFGPTGTTLSNAYYLADGSYFYTKELRNYEYKEVSDIRAEKVTASKLKELVQDGKLVGFAAASKSSYNTLTKENDAGTFPYPAITEGLSGGLVHYGNWVTPAQMGQVGVFYWEHEENGSNDGYHIHYIGYNNGTQVESTSLCTSHDDNGIITEYGYGYYLKKENNKAVGSVVLTSKEFESFNQENIYKTASTAIEALLSDFKIYAFKTGENVKTTEGDGLYLNTSSPNGTWTLEYTDADSQKNTYTYTICPFFGDSFAVGTTEKIPGTSANEYQIRSVDQLQYINWNYSNENSTTTVSATEKEEKYYYRSWSYDTYYTYSANKDNSCFPYLIYADGSDTTAGKINFYWEQTHDVNQDGSSDDNAFTPIGSLYYYQPYEFGYDSTKGRKTYIQVEGNYGTALIAFFAGSYDGQSYSIKNIEIHSDASMVGLFGITGSAVLKNIIMYSDKSNVIEITSSSRQWYSVGGLVGFAAKGSSSSASIENCAVSGYTIKDSRTTAGGWGGASIGGLVGACNMKISKCEAVNNIEINLEYTDAWQNVRVGGLVGNLRGTVDSCYAGGQITSSVNNNTHDKNQGYNSVSLWLGGINGGIVMIDCDQMKSLIGDTTAEVTISNSYSYVKLPDSNSNHVYSSQSIASIGEMENGNFRAVTNPYLNVYNCYAYKDYVTKTDDYRKVVTNGVANTKYYTGTTVSSDTCVVYTDSKGIRYIKIDNNGNSPYVTYNQLTAASEESGNVIDLLNTNGGESGASDSNSFSFVTTEENGARINGKYSFPGDTDLKGRNYPFPTVLKQSGTINVHYGNWPNGDLYWSGGGRLSINLIDDYDSSSGYATKTVTLRTSEELKDGQYSYLILGTSGSTELDENSRKIGVESTENADSETSEYVYNVVIKAVSEGTQRVRAKLASGSYDDLWVTVSAVMSLTAEPDTVTIEKGKTAELSLSVKSASGAKNLTSDVKWRFAFDDENCAGITSQALANVEGNADEKIYKVTLTGREVGKTTLRVTATYELTIKGVKQPFPAEKSIVVNVTEAADAGGDNTGGDSGSESGSESSASGN